MPFRLQQSSGLAYLGLTLTTLFWAGNAVVARSVVDTIPPVSLAFWRWVLALVILLPIGLPGIRRHWTVILANWRPLLVLAVFSVSCFNTLLYQAAITTTVLNITLVNSTVPVVVALMAWLLLGDRMRSPQVLGIALALLGMLVIIGRGELATFRRLDFQPGDLWMVAAVLCWALFSVLLRRHQIPLPAFTFLTVQVAMGTLVLLPLYLVDALMLSGGFSLTPAVVPPLLYVAIFPGILAYAFWNHGVHQVGPSRSAMFMYLNPVFAAVLAGLFLDERLSLFHLAGGLLILAGLFLATRSRPAPRPTP
ncbi:DMT family transporter [Marinobacter profundi]|uniref:EamA family transporter n=1 Tax=Marinobacter profundi TaxID=2666256 RepID=A0A2G1UH78_9GAMM|nr:DMT family transporter [Marinobacter profundi]PHQ13779.1 EamA family transporter [Marinobacter profundi]